MKPWHRHTLAALAFVTLPVWFLPFLVFMVLAFLYIGIYAMLFGEFGLAPKRDGDNK